MGNEGSIPKIRALDLKRIGEEITVGNDKEDIDEAKGEKDHLGSRYGWLCKTGLNNTKLQRRWCVIHALKLYYFEGPRSEVPKGVVNLKGAIVTESKRIPLAFDIQTGGLYSERGVEKRLYCFTPEHADENKNKALVLDREKERNRLRKLRNKWMLCIERESAKAFLPSN